MDKPHHAQEYETVIIETHVTHLHNFRATVPEGGGWQLAAMCAVGSTLFLGFNRSKHWPHDDTLAKSE